MADGLELTCEEFADGDPIPKEHGYKHGNKIPILRVSGVPANCKSLALIMDDPDAMGAVGKVWTHWLVWNMPADTTRIGSSLPEGAREGETDFGTTGYGGPAPPDTRHTYFFKLYALDTKIQLGAGATKKDLEAGIDGHVISQTQLRGTYRPQ